VKSQDYFGIKFFEETPPQPSPNQRFGEGVRIKIGKEVEYFIFSSRTGALACSRNPL
jgi:hypothetical protein